MFDITLFSRNEISSVIWGQNQCDQIGQFIALRTNFQSLWQQLICQNLLPFLGNFYKGGKIIHFSHEIIFGQLL